MQGDFLSMISYGIGILPLINNLKQERTEVTHSWCADADGALGTNQRIETYFNLLTRQDPGHGYYPEPQTSVLIVNLDNLEAGKVFGARHRFKVCMGARYLGGLHWGWQVQTRLTETADADMVKEHWRDQRNCREISSGGLCRGGTRNTIIVDIYTMRHLGHGGRVHRSEGNNSGNFFASSFLRKNWKPSHPL